MFNNDDDNSSGLGLDNDKEYLEIYEGMLVDAKGVKRRYDRFEYHGLKANISAHAMLMA